MRVTNISPNFGSFYVFSSKENNNNKERLYDAHYLIIPYEKKSGEIITRGYQNYPEEGNYTVYTKCPDGFNTDIETILLNKGVKFSKKSLEEISTLDSIISRIMLSKTQKQQNKKIVFVNTDKFDDIYAKDTNYYIERNEHGNDFIHVDRYVNSGLPINAPLVQIEENEEGEPVALFYDGRHRYCIMRDMGAKSIPIALNDRSIEIAQKHGIIDTIAD